MSKAQTSVATTSSPSTRPTVAGSASQGPAASVQPDALRNGAGEQVQESLKDRLSFSQATSLLVGLTGCSPERASDALLGTAAQLDIHPARIAPLFLKHVLTLDDGDSEAFVARLENAARAPSSGNELSVGARRPERSPADQAGARHHLAAPLARPAGRPAQDGWPSSVSVPQLTATPILVGDLRGVTVSGELDMATVPLLEDTVAEVYRTAAATPTRTTPAVFLLNLADLTFLDGSGLAALANICDQTEAQGDRLRLAVPIAAAPRRLLRLAVSRAWLGPLFDITDPAAPPDSGAVGAATSEPAVDPS